MLRSRLILIIISLGIILSLWACSKKEIKIPSTEKMPVTTNSQAALADYYRGLTFAEKLQRDQAIVHFQYALEKDSSFATAWLNLALNSQEPNQFMAYLDSAIAHSSGVNPAEQLLIQAVEFGLQGNTIKQGEALNAAVSLFPGDERLHNLLGNYHFGMQQYQLAIKAYSRAITINENLAAPYNMLGYSQRSLGNYGEAEKAFKRYIKLNPENPNAFDSYAELLLEMGRHKESNEFYQKAIDIDSTFAASYLGIATNYNFLNEFEKAREQLQLLKDIAQNYIVIRQGLRAEAVSYVSEGNFLKALESINKGMDLAIEHEDVANISFDLTTIGNAYLEMDQPEEALLYYKSSIKVIDESDLQPAIIENAQTNYKYNISRGFAAQGNFTKARKIADEFNRTVAEQKNPVQIGIGHQLNGIIALYEEKYQDALDELEKANQLNPYNLYRMGIAYDGLGNHKQAAVMMQRAEELNVLNNFDQAIVLSKTRIKAEV
ncbi:tetratricopeptide repeat protein [bacterium]|nr:tetratricopeptide repeat protein [bacterium]